MTAVLQIDQARPSGGPSFGTPGVARNDLWDARLVTLTSTHSTSSYFWTVKGPGGVAVVVTNPTAQVATFVPSGPGTYRITLSVNGGGGPNTQVRVARVRFDSAGVLSNQGMVLPAFMECETEAQEANYPGNTSGWDEPMHPIFSRVLSAPRPVANIAALRTDPSRDGTRVFVLGYYAEGDGGGGEFYWSASSTRTDDGGTCIQSSGVVTGRWLRVIDGDELDLRWFGYKGSAQQFSDGVVNTAAPNTLNSASAAFTTAVQGARVLVRTPSQPATSTVTVAINDFSIAGANFLADFHWNAGDGPLTGGLCIYIDGNYYSVNNFTDTTLYLHGRIVANATSKPLYMEQQLQAVAKYVSPTQITLWTDATFTVAVNVVINQAAVRFTFGFECDVALDAAMATSQILGISTVRLPPGLPPVFKNHQWNAYRNVKIVGAGPTATIATDLRKGSTDYTYGTQPLAVFTYDGCFNCHFEDFGYDGSVPVLGMQHSTGGFSNGSGARQGFLITNSPLSTFKNLGWGGFGARDEHALLNGTFGQLAPNFSVTGCVFGLPGQPVNGPALNIATGNGIGDNILIDDNVCYSAFCALELAVNSAIITNNHFCGYEGYPSGSSILICSASGRLIIAHNEIRNHDSSTSGIGALEINNFGILNDPDLVVVISDNLFCNLKGLYGGAGRGIIDLENFTGTAFVTNNLARNITSVPIGGFEAGRMIQVKGASTGHVYVGGNVMPCNFAGGSGMEVGLYVDADVPAGHVHRLPGNDFGDAPTPYDINSPLAPEPGMVTA